MKKNTGISIIIPCFNAERFIDKCIKSIVDQNLKEYEIIVVDDGSKDNTKEIIAKHSRENPNIHVIFNEKNMGAGYSRNTALKISKYEIVSFVDCDDYLEDNYYEELLKCMHSNDADVAVCDIFVRYEDVDGTNTRSNACSDPQDRLSFIDNGLAASPCNKIFKKELLLKYPFPELRMNEDVATVLAILMKAKKISYTDKTFYNYIQRKNSVQNSGLNENRFNIFKSLEILEERVPKNKSNEKYWLAIIHNQLTMFFFFVIPKEKNKKKRQKYLKTFNELSKKYNIRQNYLYWNFLAIQGKKHKLYYKLLMGLNYRNYYLLSNNIISLYDWYSNRYKKSVIKDNLNINDLVDEAKRQQKVRSSKITISAVIPNYNYEKFLIQRVYSILYQNVKINELIILDDCSTDNSRELIDKIEKELKPYINVRKIYNSENCGPFKQWRRGFEEATGDYVWIAEADDYCDRTFLQKITKPLAKDKNIVISYADTAFIDKDGYIILKTIKPEIDILKTGHWDHNFTEDGLAEIKKYAYLNCTIANVSSVLFKKDDYRDFFKEAGEFKQAGDWMFYLDVMSVGKVSFYNKPLNYYRVHGNNVTSLTKKQKHFNEIKKIHKVMEKKYGLTKEQKKNINDRHNFLKKVWNLDEDSNENDK